MSVIINGTTGISTDGGSDLFGTGTIGGSLTLTSGTANGVTYLNGSKVLTSGSGVTFDGTNLGVGANITASASSAPSFTVGTGSGSPAITLYSATNLQSQISFADATTGSGAYDGYLLYDQAVQNMVFGTAATERMRLTSTGLGIGTSSPAYKLEVATGTSGQQSLASFRTADSTTANNAGIQIFATPSSTATSRSTYIMWDADGANASGSDYFYIQKLGNSGQVDLIQQSAAAMTFQTTASERLRIDSAGNVGIGTSSPTKPLDVFNTASAGDNVAARFRTNFNSTDGLGVSIEFADISPTIFGKIMCSNQSASTQRALTFSTYTSTGNLTEKMRIEGDGNVGIGTSSPTQKLHISNNGNAYQLIDSSGIANGYNAATLYKNSERQYRVGTLGTVGGFAGGALVVYDETAAAWRMVINSAGNVGIGTTSISGKLSINGEVYAAAGSVSGVAYGFYPKGTYGNTGMFSPAANTVAFATTGGERVRIDSSGNVGIATSSPNFPLSFGANVGKTIALFENAGTSVYGIGMGGAGSAGDPYRTKLFSNGSERMAITDTGNVLVGTTTSSAKVTSSSSASGYNYASVSVGNQPDHIVFKADATTTGSITRVGGTGVAYNTSSDYRLKEDWVAVADASTRVNALKPVNFAWKVDGSRVDGFLAHELAEVVPEAVTGEKDAVDAEGKPKYQGIDQSKLVPLLTAALQEALARIETLEADVATLKGAA
jgi:hypothetical protein